MFCLPLRSRIARLDPQGVSLRLNGMCSSAVRSDTQGVGTSVSGLSAYSTAGKIVEHTSIGASSEYAGFNKSLRGQVRSEQYLSV
jgi:hypothetical protein